MVLSLKHILCIGLLVFSVKTTWAQGLDDFEYKRAFDKVRNHLLDGNTSEALPMLEELTEKYPNNSNINYLLGVCYTELPDVNDFSIYYLERASKNVSLDYTANSYLEQRAPVFLYYFLTVAYSQNKLCRKAENAFFQFHSLYGSHKEDFYVKDARSWVKKCELPDELKVAETSAQKVFVEEIPKEVKPMVEEIESVKKSTITKKVEYSTLRSLFGVQVGAFSRLVPIYKFEGVKNVEAFMDQEGMIRYVIGHFSMRSQAESLLKIVKEAGYPDAFIVDVNKEKKYSEELVIYNDRSLHKPTDVKKDVTFSVQIGAFKDSIPFELASKYLLIENIREMPQEDLTILLSGDFKNYDEAFQYKNELLQLGIPGVFITAFRGNEKVVIKKSMITGKEDE